MNTHQLFVKHFGDVEMVETSHPAIDAFISELNEKAASEGKKLTFYPEDESLVCCPLCFVEFRLTGKESHFAKRTGSGSKEAEPICPACVQKMENSPFFKELEHPRN